MGSRRRPAPVSAANLPASRLPIGTPTLILSGSRHELAHKSFTAPRSDRKPKMNRNSSSSDTTGTSPPDSAKDVNPSMIDEGVAVNISPLANKSKLAGNMKLSENEDAPSNGLLLSKAGPRTFASVEDSPTASIAISKLQRQRQRNEIMDPTVAIQGPVERQRRRRMKSKQWKPFDFTAEPTVPTQPSTPNLPPTDSGDGAFRAFSETHSYTRPLWNPSQHMSATTGHYDFINTDDRTLCWRHQADSMSYERSVSGPSLFSSKESTGHSLTRAGSFSVASKPEFILANDDDQDQTADQMIVESLITGDTLPPSRDIGTRTSLQRELFTMNPTVKTTTQTSKAADATKASGGSSLLSAHAVPWTGALAKGLSDTSIPQKPLGIAEPLANGVVNFLEHRNGDVSAHQWSESRKQWENIGQFSSTRHKIEGQLASDRLRGQTASQTLQQNTIGFFRAVAKQREAAATGKPFGPEELELFLPTHRPFFPITSQRIDRLLDRPSKAPESQHSLFSNLQYSESDGHAPQSSVSSSFINEAFPFLQQSGKDRLLNRDSAFQIPVRGAGLASDIQGYRAAPTAPSYGIQFPFTASARLPDTSAGVQPFPSHVFLTGSHPPAIMEQYNPFSMHMNQYNQKPTGQWMDPGQQTTTMPYFDLDPSKLASVPRVVTMRNEDPQTIPPTASLNTQRATPFSPHANPFSPFTGSHSDRLGQLVKIGDSAKERIRGQSSSRTVLYDPVQDANRDNRPEGSPHIVAPSSSQASFHHGESQTSKTPQPTNGRGLLASNSPNNGRSRKEAVSSTSATNKSFSNEIISHNPSAIATNSSAVAIGEASSPSRNEDAANINGIKIRNTLESPKNNQLSYDEQLKQWWRSNDRFARHEAFFERIKVAINDIPSHNSDTRQTTPWNETITRLLIPVHENLAAYVQGPESRRRDYFTPWSTPPHWAIDSDVGGNKSFYDEHWGTPPLRFGRDPRYRRLPLLSGPSHTQSSSSSGWRTQYGQGLDRRFPLPALF